MGIVKTINTKLVGVTQKNDKGENIQEILEALQMWGRQGEPLFLLHDPTNEYDKNAVEVFWNGDHIGYINRDMAAEIASLVDEEYVHAELCEVTGGDGLTLGCNILLKFFSEPTPFAESFQIPKRSLPEDLVSSARQYVSTQKTISIPKLQSKLGIEYSLAESLMDELEELGDVGPFQGAGQRQVLSHASKPSLVNRLFGRGK